MVTVHFQPPGAAMLTIISSMFLYCIAEATPCILMSGGIALGETGCDAPYRTVDSEEDGPCE